MNELQNCEKWYKDRLGKVTASNFSKVLGAGREKYMLELIDQMLTGKADNYSNEAMDWGKEHEDEAIETYEIVRNCRVKRVGFIPHPSETMVGGSPDGLIGLDGGIEVKCPFNPEKIGKYSKGMSIPANYYAQVQGNIWITYRQWWDFVVYDPRSRERIVVRRVLRDQLFIRTLEIEIPKFRDEYIRKLNSL